ncbi:MAG: hypothetical protein HC803_09565 [Saprospiraceae bacterium]|nr:hypothetical protein [Saprospiraceae bacterium]
MYAGMLAVIKLNIMKIKILFIVSYFLFGNSIFAQDKIPLLSGIVKISVENGTIECDLKITDLELPKDYIIRLNKGLNILNIEIKNPDPFIVVYNRDFTESIQTDETVGYYIPANNEGEKFYPDNLRFRYFGKFPVVLDTIATNMQKEDWRGNLAFVEKTLELTVCSRHGTLQYTTLLISFNSTS